jgi:hypothetical protein
MKRRSFFTTIAAVVGAAKAAPAVLKTEPTAQQISAGCIGVYTPPDFTDKQREVLRALNDSDARVVEGPADQIETRDIERTFECAGIRFAVSRKVPTREIWILHTALTPKTKTPA